LIRALVFDFDGLIVDTEGPVYQTWREVYREHGLDLPLDFWTGIIGRASNWFDPLEDLERKLGRPLDRSALDIARRVRERELVEAQPVLPGVREWMREAAAMGLATGIASSSSRAWVTGHLERLGLADGWGCIRCREDVARAKPEPDLYLAVLDCLGVEAGEAVAVEDSPNGIAAAKAAGLRCVAVPNPLTTGLDLSAADLRMPALSHAALREVLAKLDLCGSGS
jgi:HAD superfamily hydrolase (TIGR01509 family)